MANLFKESNKPVFLIAFSDEQIHRQSGLLPNLAFLRLHLHIDDGITTTFDTERFRFREKHGLLKSQLADDWPGKLD